MNEDMNVNSQAVVQPVSQPVIPPNQQPISQPSSTTSDEKNGMALAALILGIASLIIPFIGVFAGILAIIFGFIGLKKSRETGKRKGMAVAGIIMGFIGVFLLFILIGIGSMAYFGVLSPSTMLPERTTFAAPIANLDNAVIDMAENSVTVALINHKGVDITLPSTTGLLSPYSSEMACGVVTLSAIYDGNQVIFGYPGMGTTIPNGGKFLLTWDCADDVVAGTKLGDKFKATLSFDYTNVETTQTISHTGSVDGKYT